MLLKEYSLVRRLFLTQPQNAIIDTLAAEVAVLKELLSIKSKQHATSADDALIGAAELIAHAEEMIQPAQGIIGASHELVINNTSITAHGLQTVGVQGNRNPRKSSNSTCSGLLRE